MNDPRTDQAGEGTSTGPEEERREEETAWQESEAPRSADPLPGEQATGSEPGPEATTATPPPPVIVRQASTGRSFGVVLGFLALLVAFAAAGGVALTWWKVTEQQDTAANQQAEAARKLADIRALVAATQERVAAQEDRLRGFDSDSEARRKEIEGMDAELRRARARLEAMAQEDAGPERSPSIAEIEFLLLLAGRELALADNPKVALTALREADQRIARLDEPGLAEVRAAINDEIAAVEAVANIDLDGLAMRIASLARRVPGLPLRGSLAPAPQASVDDAEATEGWARVSQQLRSVGADLFRIRRSDTPATPLLAPDESFFLYRNVELDLKSARLAVLARDQQNFTASLASARAALEEYFETSDEAVRSLLAAIEALEDRDITPEWPEITRSVELLRTAGTEG
jgi:uroporphyrin-III C-methyltransferase